MIIFLGNNNTKLYEPIIKHSNGDRDIVVSCQYPFLVPESLIKSHTCVNIHYGILPQFAGCNPIYWQIMKSDMAGVTLHYMDEKFDSGDIIDIFTLPIGNLCADELFQALEKKGVDLLKKHYRGIIDNTAPRTPQNKAFRKYYPKSMVDFSKDNLLNGLDQRKIRALHFEGKQHPKIVIGGETYEIRRSDARIQ